MDNYEIARRARKTQKCVYRTNYGLIRLELGTDAQVQEANENLGKDLWSGPWMQHVPVEIRRRLTRKRWMDIGADSGWFTFKATKLSPQVITAFEPNKNAFSYIRHNHLSNDEAGIVATAFKLPVFSRPKNTHVGNITVNAEGYADINGEDEVEVPVETFDHLLTKNRYNAARIDINGYEKEFLLKGDLSRLKFLMVKLDADNYSEKELKAWMKKADKLYPHAVQLAQSKKVSIFIYWQDDL